MANGGVLQVQSKQSDSEPQFYPLVKRAQSTSNKDIAQGDETWGGTGSVKAQGAQGAVPTEGASSGLTFPFPSSGRSSRPHQAGI